jgi:hypothetical protein
MRYGCQIVSPYCSSERLCLPACAEPNVIPAKAGIHLESTLLALRNAPLTGWIPAFAGMTEI